MSAHPLYCIARGGGAAAGRKFGARADAVRWTAFRAAAEWLQGVEAGVALKCPASRSQPLPAAALQWSYTTESGKNFEPKIRIRL